MHVTAIIDELAWCQAQRWDPTGGKEIVAVRCYTKGGVPTFVPFTVLLTTSSGKRPGGLRYAYVHDNGTAIVSAYNSTGLPDTVSNLATGVWRVRLHGAGPATRSGGIQVTAVNTTDQRSATWPADLDDVTSDDHRALLHRRRQAAQDRLEPDLPARPGHHRRQAEAVRLHAQHQAADRRAVRASAASHEPQLRQRGQHDPAVRRRRVAGQLPRVGLRPNTVFVTAASTPPGMQPEHQWATTPRQPGRGSSPSATSSATSSAAR